MRTALGRLSQSHPQYMKVALSKQLGHSAPGLNPHTHLRNRDSSV